MPPKKSTVKKNDKEEDKKDPDPDIVVGSVGTDGLKITEVKKEAIAVTEYTPEKYDYDKYPLCFQMPKIKKSIFDTDTTVTFATHIDYPRFEYGFHHFIHQGKNYFGDNIKSFEGKKPVWRVMNKYETKIDNYDKSISDVTKDYFEMQKKIQKY
jgi:hypothetical protein